MKFLKASAAAAVLLFTPVAAWASCDSYCSNHCANAHPNNPGARGNCYGGCVAGCEAALNDRVAEQAP